MRKKSAEVPAPKTSRTPPALSPQKHGGALLSGGKLGNKGGRRPSNDELAWMKKLANSPRMKRRLRQLVRKGRDGDLLALQKLLLERSYGAPHQKIANTITLAELLEEEEG